MEWTLIVTIILNLFIILITLYLFLLYAIKKTFHTYPCYNLILLSLTVLLDNCIRLIPTKSDVFRYIQAFILIFFDKLILAILTIYTAIIYLGYIKQNIYKNYMKKIIWSTWSISILINLAISILYISYGKVDYKMYSYCEDNNIKKYIDTIYNSVLVCINLYCIINTLIFLFKYKKQEDMGYIENTGHGYFFYKTLIMLFANLLIFVESYLIIYKLFIFEIDLIYLSTCFAIDLFYTINKTTYEETIKLFSSNNPKNQRINSFVIESGEDK